jgi:thymidylate synthase (FAD)
MSTIDEAIDEVRGCASRMSQSIVRSWSYLDDATWQRAKDILTMENLWTLCLVFAGWLLATIIGENATYLRKILSSGHGSVLEHANYTLLFYGIDRACTHELVRHRAGMAYSQVSQRYVDGRHLRFCMPFEYQQREELTTSFEKYIDYAADTYANRTEELKLVFPQQPGEVATDWRKRIQSCARECLPNATEAPIIVTGNARSWRHVLSMRTAKAADVRIRRPMIRALQVLQAAAPDLFGDFRTFNLPDGSIGAEAEFPKP